MNRLTTAALAAVIMAACSGGVHNGSSSAGPGGSSVSLEAALAADLGKPGRLLVGLGSTDQSDIAAQGITPDIYERYLNSLH